MRERERERERRLEEVNMVFETIGESLVVVFVSSNSYITNIARYERCRQIMSINFIKTSIM